MRFLCTECCPSPQRAGSCWPRRRSKRVELYGRPAHHARRPANTTDVYAFVREENGSKVLVTALG